MVEKGGTLRGLKPPSCYREGLDTEVLCGLNRSIYSNRAVSNFNTLKEMQ